MSSDWVKVKFENTKYGNIYIVNKWTGEIIEEKDLYKAQFPINKPGTYHFIINAGTKAKWLYMKKFDEMIPDGAEIKYGISVSNDKQTWQTYSSIPEIDQYTQYIKIDVELIANSNGECPNLGGLVVKYKYMDDILEEDEEVDIGEVILLESTNVKKTANGYKALNPDEPAVLTQKIKLANPMKPEEIQSSIDIPANNVSTRIYVSNDQSEWIPIEEADPNTTYRHVKIQNTIPENSPEEIGIASVKPKQERSLEADVDEWKTINTRYYYALADKPVAWIGKEVDEVIPEDTRILYLFSKSNDGDNWTGYSEEITDNNNSEYIKVKIDFQVKNNTQTNNIPELKSIEIISKYNEEETKNKTNKTLQLHLNVTSQNTEYGTVSENSGIYKYKDTITVTATPKDGYMLVGWSNGQGIVSKEESYTFTMPNYDYSLNAIWITSNASLGEVLVYDEHTTFVVVKDGKSWSNAASFAASYGGRLAVIDCKEKQDLIYSKVKSVGDVWIGLTDEAEEGIWRYTDGRLATIYTNWNGGEPNNSGGEDYAEMYMSSGKWNDLNGSQSYPFIIEFNN